MEGSKAGNHVASVRKIQFYVLLSQKCLEAPSLEVTNALSELQPLRDSASRKKLAAAERDMLESDLSDADEKMEDRPVPCNGDTNSA